MNIRMRKDISFEDFRRQVYNGVVNSGKKELIEDLDNKSFGPWYFHMTYNAGFSVGDAIRYNLLMDQELDEASACKEMAIIDKKYKDRSSL